MDSEREELEELRQFLSTTTYMIKEAADILDNRGAPLNPQRKAEIEENLKGFVFLISLKVVS